MSENISKKEHKLMDTMIELIEQGKFKTAIKLGDESISEFPEQVFFYIGISIAHANQVILIVVFPF